MVTALFLILFQWNISDFLSQHREKIRTALEEAESPANDGTNEASNIGAKYDKPVPPSDRQWMCLYSKLGELCVDPRPAVRKSAGQTLFSTINAHGSLLDNVTWYTVLWQVSMPTSLPGNQFFLGTRFPEIVLQFHRQKYSTSRSTSLYFVVDSILELMSTLNSVAPSVTH